VAASTVSAYYHTTAALLLALAFAGTLRYNCAQTAEWAIWAILKIYGMMDVPGIFHEPAPSVSGGQCDLVLGKGSGERSIHQPNGQRPRTLVDTSVHEQDVVWSAHGAVRH
jgi:hypothetical protein